MGLTLGSRTIYGLNNLNQISLIYEGISGEDDQGNKGSSEFRNIDDNFEINFQKISKSSHYDLVEIKKSHGKKVKTRTYKFNENTFKYE
jgi:rubredoxin